MITIATFTVTFALLGVANKKDNQTKLDATVWASLLGTFLGLIFASLVGFAFHTTKVVTQIPLQGSGYTGYAIVREGDVLEPMLVKTEHHCEDGYLRWGALFNLTISDSWWICAERPREFKILLPRD